MKSEFDKKVEEIEKARDSFRKDYERLLVTDFLNCATIESARINGMKIGRKLTAKEDNFIISCYFNKEDYWF